MLAGITATFPNCMPTMAPVIEQAEIVLHLEKWKDVFAILSSCMSVQQNMYISWLCHLNWTSRDRVASLDVKGCVCHPVCLYESSSTLAYFLIKPFKRPQWLSKLFFACLWYNCAWVVFPFLRLLLTLYMQCRIIQYLNTRSTYKNILLNEHRNSILRDQGRANICSYDTSEYV